MDFFSIDNLDKFRNNNEIKTFMQTNMNNSVLLNMNEMRDYFRFEESNLHYKIPSELLEADKEDYNGRNIKRALELRKAQQKLEIAKEQYNNNLYWYLFHLTYELCTTIDTRYGMSSINNALNHDEMYNDRLNKKIKLQLPLQKPIIPKEKLPLIKSNIRHVNFDILMLLSKNYKDLKEYNKETKLEEILGFIVVEKGECKLHPNAYTINLICTRNTYKGEKVSWIKSSILLGAYLCMIKSINCEQIGLLELADGYENIPALCAYTKFGFKKDTSLESNDCFWDSNNLAMSIKLDSPEITYDDIIKIVTSNQPITNEYHDLCKTFLPKTESQKIKQIKIARCYQRISKTMHQTNTRKKNIKNLKNELIKLKEDFIDTQVDKSSDTPTHDAIDKSSDKLFDEPSDKSFDEPKKKSFNKSKKKSFNESNDKSPHEPSDKSPHEPIDKSSHEPSDKSSDEASDKSSEEPSDKSSDEPNDKSSREPSDDASDISKALGGKINKKSLRKSQKRSFRKSQKKSFAKFQRKSFKKSSRKKFPKTNTK